MNCDINNKIYKKLLSCYKFVAFSTNNDSNYQYIWEALRAQTIPIIKHSLVTDKFLKIGLPIWVVDDWKELDAFREQELSIKYEELKNNFKNAFEVEDWNKMIVNFNF